jgi:hypothetical protein
MRSALAIIMALAVGLTEIAASQRPVFSAAGANQTRDQKNDPASAKQGTSPAAPDSSASSSSHSFVPGSSAHSSVHSSVQQKPLKVVVRKGGAKEPEAQIVTGMTPEEASTERQEAEKLLSSADENLRRILGRTLDPQQQEDFSQVHNYVGRARAALKEGDISRGHTLAMKANLLAQDLVQH